MAPPRYLFTARVVPSADGADPRIAWRLVGGNNHELGRSFDTFGDLDACVAAVRVLQQRVNDVEAEVTASGTQWGWVLRLDGEAVAVSCRWYRRVRESQYNLVQFLAVAPSAGLTDGVGSQPVRRELLRPDYVLPHHVPATIADDLDGRDEDAVDVDAALTQDLPAEQVDELTEAS
jgi:hypothetical protein